MKRNFDSEAKNWDDNEYRLKMSLSIADTMTVALDPAGYETLIDYGAGTGVIALKLSERVGTVVAADSSKGMLEVLDAKIAASGLSNIRSLFLDLESYPSAAEGLRDDTSPHCRHSKNHGNVLLRSQARWTDRYCRPLHRSGRFSFRQHRCRAFRI